MWFSKAAAKECRKIDIITLIMPTRFMAECIRNNYSHVIQRLIGNTVVKRVQYRYM
ncbi:DnaA N-terminal domain-containing protein [Rickettsia prowazekii]|uniref:DnaA N-terminal domain-containing protein n=1 Tax=Rickettsia prowazekii TaxID=782 RepID=UPI001E46C774|nr:DnaA N-terminal domain-containing protein [Rickettsia prowazekii]